MPLIAGGSMRTELRCSSEINFEAIEAMRLRDLAKFVKSANHFSCSVMVTCLGRRVDGKSFIELSNLRLKDAGKMLLETWGWDAPEAIEELSKIARQRNPHELEMVH
jgi:phosphotransferase system HPr (HPr) family protein